MIYIILALFFVAESEKDIIKNNPSKSFFPNWKWYNETNYTGKSWLRKNVFNFINNGWHFWKAVSIIIPSYFTTQIVGVSVYYSILFFALAGLYHSYRNRSLLRKL